MLVLVVRVYSLFFNFSKELHLELDRRRSSVGCGICGGRVVLFHEDDHIGPNNPRPHTLIPPEVPPRHVTYQGDHSLCAISAAVFRSLAEVTVDCWIPTKDRK